MKLINKYLGKKKLIELVTFAWQIIFVANKIIIL